MLPFGSHPGLPGAEDRCSDRLEGILNRAYDVGKKAHASHTPDHAGLFVGVFQKSILNRVCQPLAIRAHEMAPRTSQGLQERAWDTPAKGHLGALGALAHLAPGIPSSLLTSNLSKSDQLRTTHPPPSTCNQDLTYRHPELPNPKLKPQTPHPTLGGHMDQRGRQVLLADFSFLH